MQKEKSILLLFLMGIILFPWQLICLAHPLGEHDHAGDSDHKKISNCELRRQYTGEQSVIWPPMHCKHEVLKSAKFQQPQIDCLILSVSPFVVITSNYEFTFNSKAIKPHLFLEEPNCRSASIISDHPHRGPPLV
ncbi:hypothetical protein [Flavobacterium cellulosilyticum]|uniref:DUF2946 domain-containing protein n=1 Tax=Flavobacterium cellulosilyticum TaxID=2541731 RepID=A0A4R5C702_9FLAO|nr:hypothetical protein [Flavobacterium cellulosilyticum]TDD95488.1 hypothetical protein E0F76_13535 [Flavobacterium cellulosilyticum]